MTRREWMLTVAAAMGAFQPSSANTDEVTTLSLTELVARIERRELSPLNVTEAYLARITSINPDLNALVTVTAARAREDAWRVSRALTPPPYNTRNASTPALLGAPIAHKDLFETSGIRTTAGSRLYESYVPKRDAEIVSRLAKAGAVLIGKTNTHELGGGVTTINPFFGTTRNPVDQTRIPGGSSGGSAAAVVARLSVAATGSDTGGSVRIPAALCGCVGFKPTFGRVSIRGLLGSCPTFDHVGFLTRTVDDAALMFSAALGVDKPKGLSPQSLSRAPGARGDKPSGLSRPSAPSTPSHGDKPLGLSGIRIGVPRRFFFDRLQPDVARAIDAAIQKFRNLGAAVDEVDFPIDERTMSRVFDPIVVSEIWAAHGNDWRQRSNAFSPSFAAVFKTPPPSSTAVAQARRALAEYRQTVDQVFDRVNVLLTPTVAITAPKIEGPIDGPLILRNTWPFNAAGTPAISIPCGVDAAGLPIGLQLVARRQQDQVVLHAARTYERGAA
jgi:aspartyl-tRNA(Asn)/glutamyl-tRNA(Gln) amidotransferase subunit A